MTKRLDDELWADVAKFVRWSANVREDSLENIAIARELAHRIQDVTLEPDAAESFRGRLAAALIEYLHTVQPYIDFTASCAYGDEPADHGEALDLASKLAAIDERLRSGGSPA